MPPGFGRTSAGQFNDGSTPESQVSEGAPNIMMRRRGVGIVGVAAVAHHAAKKGAEEQAAADQNAQLEQENAELAAQQQAPAAPTAAPAAAPVDPVTAQLENLANLHTQGILSDEEFAAAKAKALGI
jgi:hypothetical protein